MFFETLVVVLLLSLLAGVALIWRRQEADSAKHEAESRRQFGRIQIFFALLDRLDLRQGVAYDADWSAAPDFLRLIVDHALNAKPRLIVECGCGVSTLMLARCCALNGTGEVVSLEQGAEYAARARAELQRYGLAEHTRVIDAPTREYPFAGDRFAWYDFEGLPDAPIDMLVIDGPPGFSRRHARYPALPLLFERLADDCIIFLDDAARPDEREIVALWLKRHPELLSDYLKLERGCAILRLKRPTGDTNECR